MSIREYLKKHKILADGAMGTYFEMLHSGQVSEYANLENPREVEKIHLAYIKAGANLIMTNTFAANEHSMGLSSKKVDECVRKGIEIARSAIDKSGQQNLFLAGDIGRIVENGENSSEALQKRYQRNIDIFLEEKVPVIVFETFLDLEPIRPLVKYIREKNTEVFIIVSLCVNKNGYTTSGMSGRRLLEELVEMEEVDACGLNCGIGSGHMLQLAQDLQDLFQQKYFLIMPNAGYPEQMRNRMVFLDNRKYFADNMQEIADLNVAIVGGCCGTTPEFIRELSAMAEQETVPEVSNTYKLRLASERKALQVEENGRFLIVGERINPTGKKALQAELREGIYSRVLDFAEEQEACGAAILDVNVGMSGIDEKQVMLDVLQEVSMASNLPLSIDSSYVEVIEAALRNYPGRAIINSISLETEKFEKLIPIAAKYGAAFILLPLSDQGLPKNLDEKKEIIHTILNRAEEYGINRKDIVVDGLVATVGANQSAALETLETIRYCKDALGLATICGLSNISFGLPDRSFINTAFLTLAIQAGLTMAIANPSQEMLVKCAAATDLLMNKQESDLAYIETVGRFQKTESAGIVQEKPKRPMIFEDVLKGNKKTIVSHVKEALEQKTATPKEILDTMLIAAINEVGELFDKKKYFLPQLISSAEAMKTAIEYLEPMLMDDDENGDAAVIVIATVEGDIHDIGKNLVALMLKNYGYRVIDLGKDVPKETIVETAIKENASIIGLSALMTTTMQEMENVVKYAKEQNCHAKIIIGGAVITEEYAKEIYADGYSKDAADAVRVVKELLGE